ncbi:MAG: hypothetical protein ACNA8L_05015 [Luteolibacter sp.]
MKNKILNIIGIAFIASFSSVHAAELEIPNGSHPATGSPTANILESAETSYGYGRGGYGSPYRRGYPYRRGGGYRRCY